MNWKLWTAALAVCALAAGCGGGGGDAGTSPFGGSNNDPSSGTPVVRAANLSMELTPSQSVPNTDTTGVTATVTATDTSGKVLAGVPVTFKVSSGTYAQASSSTDANGENKAVVKIGADKSNRTITISATDGSTTVSKSFTVTGASLSSTANPSLLAPGASGSVIFRLTDASASAMANLPIEIQVFAGTSVIASSSAFTGSDGSYTYAYTAPSSTGTLTVVATAGGVTVSQDVQVQTSSTVIPNATETPTSAALDVNPAVVAVNTAGSTANAATVRIRFLGASNNPLPNVRVKFDLNGDTNSVGGTFSASELYSDAQGYAITSYIPGTTSSPTDGVTIRACYRIDSTPASVTCTPGVGGNQKTKTLTVAAEAVSVTVGSDGFVGVDDDNISYYRRFVVQVVDSAGRAMKDVAVTSQLDLREFRKGSYTKGSDGWVPGTRVACNNEDSNRNNQVTAGEDLNHNGTLEPRKADAAVAFDNTASNGKTDATGRIVLRVTYPKSVGSWLKAALTVTGSVNGSEGRYTLVEWLPVDVESLGAEGSPAYELSPYGTVTSTTALPFTFPDGTTRTTGLDVTACENPN